MGGRLPAWAETGLQPGPALRTPRWAVGPPLDRALWGGGSADKRLASQSVMQGALGLVSCGVAPLAARDGARVLRVFAGLVRFREVMGGPSHPRTRGGGMTASVPGETADVPARALGACGLVVVQAVWAAPCSPVSPERHIEPASSSASRKDRQRHGLQFLPSPSSHATSGSCGHGRPLPSAAPRAVWATTCLDGSPGRWAHSGPLERLLGSVGSLPRAPRPCRAECARLGRLLGSCTCVPGPFLGFHILLDASKSYLRHRGGFRRFLYLNVGGREGETDLHPLFTPQVAAPAGPKPGASGSHAGAGTQALEQRVTDVPTRMPALQAAAQPGTPPRLPCVVIFTSWALSALAALFV